MKKINVVKSNEDFNNVMNTGKCFKNRYFVLYSKNTDTNEDSTHKKQ